MNDDATPPHLLPKHLTKQGFGRRLSALMYAKNWTQSDLARRADLPRDSISTYINGKSLPTPKSLQKLANALGLAPEEILPNHAESAIDEDNPVLDIKVSPGAPDLAWLRVNRLVTIQTALKIADLLKDDVSNVREKL